MDESKNKEMSIQPVTNCDQLANPTIEKLILNIRGQQVMLDRDLARLYEVETRVLNQAVKRNIERFPDSFRFQLSKEEKAEVITICDNPDEIRFSPSFPYVFTEQGVAMLSAVLRSKTAIYVSIEIMNAFVAMRHFLSNNAQVFKRLETIEYNQLAMLQHQQESDKRIDEIFQKFEDKEETTQGIFFDGQVFDAYVFISDLVKSATTSIILIDNYVDETVLTILDKRENGVVATIYTQQISRQLQLDINRHNAQYPPITANVFHQAHDRFLIIDDEVYHIGASIKDLGKKWFGFTLMRDITATEIINRINGVH